MSEEFAKEIISLIPHTETNPIKVGDSISFHIVNAQLGLNNIQQAKAYLQEMANEGYLEYQSAQANSDGGLRLSGYFLTQKGFNLL